MGIIPKSLRKDVDSVISQLDNQLQFTAIASTGNPDRENDIISLDAWSWDEFLRNPVICLNHNYSELPPVAKCVKIWKDYANNALMITIEFPKPGVYPLADSVRGLMRDEFLTTFSVGFVGKEYDYIPGTGGRNYTSVELLEVSIVNLPANTDARVQRAVSKGFLTEKQSRLLNNTTVSNMHLDSTLRQKIRERGVNPDAKDLNRVLEPWQILEIQESIVEEMRSGRPNKRKNKFEMPEILHAPKWHVPLDLREKTELKIKIKEIDQREENERKLRWY